MFAVWPYPTPATETGCDPALFVRHLLSHFGPALAVEPAAPAAPAVAIAAAAVAGFALVAEAAAARRSSAET